MNRVASVIKLDHARKQGLTGKGIGIAIMDTGVGMHPDIIYKNGPLMSFYDTLAHHNNFYDDNGHGTHVAGIICGNGTASNKLYEGIAPDCKIHIIKILNKNGEGNIKNVISGIEWLLKNKDKYNIRIVNISVGSVSLKKFDESSLLVRSINSLWEAGLVVVTAAGNNGPSDYTIGAPGNSRKIITVGTSDSVKGKFTHDFSGRGPTMNCIKKPDIVAPGLNTISCNNIINRSFYIPRSGTSMSTPIVSGCIALLLQKYPYFTNKDVKLQLKRTAIDLHMPHEKQGWGLIRCDTFLS